SCRPPARNPLSAYFCQKFFFFRHVAPRYRHSFPTRRSSDLERAREDVQSARVVCGERVGAMHQVQRSTVLRARLGKSQHEAPCRSEEHTSELQSLAYLVCRLLLAKKKS